MSLQSVQCPPVGSCPAPQTLITTSNICKSGDTTLEYCPPTSNLLVTTNRLTSLTCYCASVPASTTAPNTSVRTTLEPGHTSPSLTSSPSPAPTSSTVSQTSPNTTGNTSTSPPAAENVSTGAAIGIGIGCALVGALLAGLIVFLLSRRKRRQPAYPQQHLLPDGRAYGQQEKHGMTATSASVQSGVVVNIDRLLPQPAEDDAIVGALSKIRDGIKNHAQNYYHNAPIGQDAVDEARLVELANTTAMPPSAIRNLLQNPATRVPAIRLFLGHLILSSCTGGTDGRLSFLPSEISNLATIPTGTGGTTASQAALFSKLKAILGALLQQKYGHQLDENDPRGGSITQALAATDPILHPFINPSIDMNARRRNLEGIMRRAAQFAFLLFSQPGSFQFDYTGSGQPDSLLVFPALLQAANDEAQPLLPPRVLSEKEVVTGLGV